MKIFRATFRGGGQVSRIAFKVPGVHQDLERQPLFGREKYLDDFFVVLFRGSGLLKHILSRDLMTGAGSGAGSRGNLSKSLLGLRGEDVVCLPILKEKNSPWVYLPDWNLRDTGLRTSGKQKIIDFL